ncbi:MAG: hypothetical protein PHR35_19600, partial [Kiritimatiellae bacterium]|nr:hypothetical protein [Kiritimatiellia bacterium]
MSESCGDRDGGGTNPFDAWLEAVALALVVVLPITLWPLNNFRFEEAKAYLFHACGMAGGLLLLARWIADAPWRRVERRLGREGGWMIVAAAAFLVSQGISAALAVQRSHAIYGAPGRGGGLLTMLSAGILLATTVTIGRRPGTVRRLLEAMSLGSLPPLLFGLMQCLGHDPLGIGTAAHQDRIGGSFGNPIFLGGYLALLLPLTVWLAVEHARASARRKAALFGLLAAMQAAALWCSGSRGPLGASIVGAGVALLLLLLARGRRRLAGGLAALGLCGLLGALVVFHQCVAAPLLQHDSHACGDRFNRAGSVLVRLHIFRAIADTMSDRVPLAQNVDPANRDPHARLRPWLGYGPQNLSAITDRHFPPELLRLEGEQRVIDAAHNFFMEVWADAGVLGVGTWLLLLLAAMSALLAALGLGAERGKWLYRTPLLLMAAAGALLATACWGLWAWSLGLSLGLLAGWLLVILLAAFRGD